jgi:uncharacterized protein
MADFDLLRECTGFEWDAGNAEKNWSAHRVSRGETEEMFFNRPLVTSEDPRHSSEEPRFYALGHANSGRFLFVAFTIRGNRIRVISARDMSRRERKVHEGRQ